MMLEDAKQTWQEEDDPSSGDLSDEDVLRMVRERTADFDQKLRRRNLREGIAGAIAFIGFATMLFDPSWIVRLGAIIVMGSTVFIYWTLRRARRSPSVSSPEQSVADAIRAQRQKVDAQIRLLENVLWWYILPLTIGILLVVIGDDGASWFTLGYAALVVVAGAGVYALNRWTVENSLRPRRNELTDLLQQIEEP